MHQYVTFYLSMNGARHINTPDDAVAGADSERKPVEQAR
jgi:hypothetical protein